MAAKLSTANPYLRDAAQRERLVFQSVASSSAVEGIREPFKHKAKILGKRVASSSPRTKAPR